MAETLRLRFSELGIEATAGDHDTPSGKVHVTESDARKITEDNDPDPEIVMDECSGARDSGHHWVMRTVGRRMIR